MRVRILRRRTVMKLGLGLGAAVMYLFDPDSGDDRRARLLGRLEELADGEAPATS